FYSVYSTAATYVGDPSKNFAFFKSATYISINAFLFYAIIYLVSPSVFEKRNIKKAFFMFGLVCIVYYTLQWTRIWFRTINENLPAHYTNHSYLIPQFIMVIVQFTAFALVYCFYKHSVKQKEQKLILEQEKHRIEIGFLRGQINDHFIYNLLNMFHSQAAAHSDQLADGILSLSELMRYSVAEQEKGLVALDEEIRHIQLLIALNKQRFGPKAQVIFEIEGNTHGWQVPHLGLLTLVENCFKHGSVTQAPLVINLYLTLQMLVFKTQNRVKTTPSVVSTSLGLQNLARRLELLCPGRTSFQSRKEGTDFFTELHISK
ncbi:MAG: hypothetical protein EAZ80_13295, partial [Runella slithyformis]